MHHVAAGALTDCGGEGATARVHEAFAPSIQGCAVLKICQRCAIKLPSSPGCQPHAPPPALYMDRHKMLPINSCFQGRSLSKHLLLLFYFKEIVPEYINAFYC